MEKFQELEKSRKNSLYFIMAGIGIFVLGAILLLLLMNTNVAFLGIIVALAGIVVLGIGASKAASLTKKFKSDMMHSLLNEVIPGATFNASMGIPMNDIYSCGFLAKADRSYTEDLIQGNIEGVKFKTCDLKLEEKHVHHTAKGQTVVQYVTYFQGRFFEIDFNKEFKGKLFVTEGRLPTLFSKMKKVELESAEFNKKFKTYSADELSVFYVLTPHLMTSLMELERRNPGVIAMSFSSTKLVIAIDNRRDTFSIRLTQKIDERLLDAFKKDIEVIKEIILELKLNRNIFIKEE